MHLKRLELVGFKSFANRVKLEFGQGITGIVGPNGSGKSNISDAIRWVLGEQSIKSLRGTKLEDVIFAGSAGKRPLGMAEVQLTFDNTDGFLPLEFNEVTVTRRVYRSGESDFMINRQPCRLRDIQDLFTDTGLGREGFAIIGQGQIDAVLSANPADRRFILEETAGIVKYRNRKEQAYKKMIETDYDLVRIGDILSELKEQAIPLETEAKKAREYQTLSSQLDTVILDKFCLQLNQLSKKQTEITETLKSNQEEATELSKNYHQYEQDVVADQDKLALLELENENYQYQISEINELINATMQTIGLNEERLKHNQQSQAERSDSIQKQKANLEQLRKNLAEVRAELSSKDSEYQNLNQTISGFQQQLAKMRSGLQDKRQELEIEKDNFIDFVQDLADARNFSSNYQHQTAQLEQRIADLTGELMVVTREEEKLQEQIKEQSAIYTSLVEDHNLQTETLERLTRLDQELTKQLAELNQQEQKINQSYQQTNSRLQALQDLESEYEGYSFSVRRIMQAEIENVSILGTVANLITVPQRLATAIEVALGGALQYLITPTEKDAKLAIEWLKKNRSGRCTFLPLNTIKGQAFPQNYSKYWQEEKCLGSAVDLIEFDPHFRPALAALLGRVVIVEDLDTALKMQKQIPSFSRIVTLAGEVVMPNGSLTGGSINTKGNSHGLLARKAEIAEREKDLVKIKLKMEEISQKQEQAKKNLAAVKQEFSEEQQAYYQLEIKIQGVKSELGKVKAETERSDQQLSLKRKQLDELKTTQRELVDQAAASQEKIIVLEADENKKRTAIQNLETEIANLEKEVNAKAEIITADQITLSRFSAELKQLAEQEKNLEKQIEGTVATINEIEAELSNLKSQATAIDELVALNQAQLQVKRSEKQELTAKLDQSKVARNILQTSVQEHNKKLKELQTRINKLDKQIYAQQMELERIELETRRIDEDLVEQEITQATVKARLVDSTITKLKSAEAELKNKIRELGIVNLGALQDYDAVKERIFFLQVQYDDLIQAKNTLHETVTEIDATSSERLTATYKELRREFQSMFSQLFKGGSADLLLTDPGNILESGIDIIAQPPGKKTRHLSLLSGGERALTAIALLLAIRTIKPTPFCILDEIDAALDEINLRRFIDQMQVLAAENQFLIITHRPSTMEVVDRLYGVTMIDDATS